MPLAIGVGTEVGSAESAGEALVDAQMEERVRRPFRRPDALHRPLAETALLLDGGPRCQGRSTLRS